MHCERLLHPRWTCIFLSAFFTHPSLNRHHLFAYTLPQFVDPHALVLHIHRVLGSGRCKRDLGVSRTRSLSNCRALVTTFETPRNPSLRPPTMKPFLTLALASLCLASPILAEETKVWGYKLDDPAFLSPSEWGLEYPTCNGKRQSPVDIKSEKTCGKQAPLAFSGDCATFSVQQTEEAYKFAVQNGWWSA